MKKKNHVALFSVIQRITITVGMHIKCTYILWLQYAYSNIFKGKKKYIQSFIAVSFNKTILMKIKIAQPLFRVLFIMSYDHNFSSEYTLIKMYHLLDDIKVYLLSIRTIECVLRVFEVFTSPTIELPCPHVSKSVNTP